MVAKDEIICLQKLKKQPMRWYFVVAEDKKARGKQKSDQLGISGVLWLSVVKHKKVIFPN